MVGLVGGRGCAGVVVGFLVGVAIFAKYEKVVQDRFWFVCL